MTPDQRRARVRGRVVAWILLIVMGTSTIILNVYHAVHTGDLGPLLAVLIALIPVIAYAGLSEIVAVFRGNVLRALTIVSMLLGMAMSVYAVAAVVRPETGDYLCWVFGAVLDLPVIVSLHVIMNEPADGREEPAAEGPRKTTPAKRKAAPAKAAPAHGPAARPELGATRAGATVMGHGPSPAEPAGHPETAVAETPKANPESASGSSPAAESGSFQERAAEHERARRRYQESVDDGKALSDRALGNEFGRSRNWGAKRIEEVESELALASSQ